MSAREVWNNYWFNPAPLLNLAICRIAAVGFQLAFLLWNFQYSNFTVIKGFSEQPDTLYSPLLVLRFLTFPFGSHYRPTLEVVEVVYWITIFAGVLSLIGLMTNLGLVAFAAGCLFLQSFIYSFGDFHHAEAVMMIALSILALSPSGAVLSIDDLRRRLLRARQRSQLEEFNILEEKSPFARWPILLIQWIIVLLYTSAFISKMFHSGMGWMNGYTLQYILIEDGLRDQNHLGIWLGQFHTLLQILQIIVMLFQGTFFLVLIFPWTAVLFLPMGVAFHTGNYVFLSTPFYQWVTLYAVFVPWTQAVQFLSRFRRVQAAQKKVEILYDGQCPLCIRSMTQLRYFDWFNRLAYSDVLKRWPSVAERLHGTTLDDCLREMYVLLPEGSVRKGFFAFREILRHLPPLWPLLVFFHLPYASRFGPPIYNFVASNRFRFKKCDDDTCARPDHSNRT